MRVLCGQCGQVHDLEEGFGEPTVECTRCGHIVPIPRFDARPAPAPDAEEILEFELDEDAERGFAEQAKSATERRIPITCPNCGKTVRVSARYAGRTGRCKTCDHRIQIPYPDDLEEFKLPGVRRVAGDYETGLELVTAAEGPGVTGAPPQPSQPLDELAAAGAAPAAVPSVEPEPVEPKETGQLATAVKGYRGGKAAARRRGRAKSRGARWALVLLVAAVAVAVPLVVVVPILFPRTDGESSRRVAGSTQPVKTPRLAAGATQPATRKVVPSTRPRPKVPTCTVLAVKADPFAAGGYFPAAPGSVYWKVTAEINAGHRPLALNTFAPDVTMMVAGRQFPSLGTAVGAGAALPVRSRRGAVKLQPRQSKRITLLFELPQRTTAGRLCIVNVGETPVSLPAPPASAPQDAVAGTYVERAPRNLRPLLRDPVMAAIQSAPDQHLIVHPGAEGIRVVIPEAMVSGVGKPTGPGLFRAALRYQSHALNCTLRFLDGGRGLILYLADEPFHQLTYVNPQARPLPRPEPRRPAATTRPGPTTATSRPSPVDPKAVVKGLTPAGPGMGRTVWQPVPGYDPNAKPSTTQPEKLPTGPSIFD